MPQPGERGPFLATLTVVESLVGQRLLEETARRTQRFAKGNGSPDRKLGKPSVCRMEASANRSWERRRSGHRKFGNKL